MTLQHPESEVPFTERLVIPVHLSGTGNRQILLQLDSGSDGLILYAGNNDRTPGLLRATLQGSGVSKAQQAFAILPPQDMQIGSHTLSHVYFVTPVSVRRDVPKQEKTVCCQQCSSSDSSLAAAEITTWSSSRSEPTLSRLAGRGLGVTGSSIYSF